MARRIVHIDMDAFFAAVEVVRDPSLAGKPLIIGGNKDDRRGVVSTASYKAREFGVHSAMPIAEAVRLCPQGIFMRGTRSAYGEASRAIRTILESITPLVEFASIDEAYMDVTGSMHAYANDEELGQHIKDEIRRATELPSTLAISSNKLISKIGSDYAKPDGFVSIPEGGEAAFLAPMALKKLPGVGPKTRERLELLGIETIGALAAAPEQELLRILGPAGYAMQRRARGQSRSEVVPHRKPKSISRETTFAEDRNDWPKIESIIYEFAERCMHNLREREMETRCVNLKMREADFTLKTFAHTLPGPTSRDDEILRALRGLIEKARARRKPVRLIGVGLSQLSQGQHQMSLFDEEENRRQEKVNKSVDTVREKFGFDAIHTAKSLDTEDR